MSVLVVGGGVAGTAAVYRALEREEPCTWIHMGVGASAANGGALDWDYDGDDPIGDEPMVGLSPELERFGSGVLGWQLPAQGVRVVTPEGQVRHARGCDLGILNLAALGAGVLAVLDVPRPGWDAPRLCAALNGDVWLRARGLRCVALKLDVDGLGLPSGLADAEYARGFGAASGVAERLASMLTADVRAVLAGPWLFSDATAASALRAVVAQTRPGVVVGETLSPPFGLAGRRFEASRAALVARSPTLEVIVGKALRVDTEGAGFSAQVSTPGAVMVSGEQVRKVSARRCVLAMGGLVSGALRLDAQRRLGLEVVLEPPRPLLYTGRPLLPVAAETGFDVQAFGLEALSNVGLTARPSDGPLGGGTVRVVGDLVADVPRTALRAAQSGLEAFEP
jgi:hypothetical protein